MKKLARILWRKRRKGTVRKKENEGQREGEKGKKGGIFLIFFASFPQGNSMGTPAGSQKLLPDVLLFCPPIIILFLCISKEISLKWWSNDRWDTGCLVQNYFYMNRNTVSCMSNKKGNSDSFIIWTNSINFLWNTSVMVHPTTSSFLWLLHVFAPLASSASSLLMFQNAIKL